MRVRFLSCWIGGHSWEYLHAFDGYYLGEIQKAREGKDGWIVPFYPIRRCTGCGKYAEGWS